MRLLKDLLIALIVGVILASIFSQFTTSKYPPCDLVAKGIGVSTYGCSNTAVTNYPCKNIAPNTAQMATCIQQSYYRTKTFPFGFKQPFGEHSNLIDQRPLNYNRLASLFTGFGITLLILFVIQLRSKSSSPVTEK